MDVPDRPLYHLPKPTPTDRPASRSRRWNSSAAWRPSSQRHGDIVTARRRAGAQCEVIAAVYDARGAPEHAAGLRARHAPTLNALLAACGQFANDARHEKARALARELLNDWDTFWVVLDHPELPLTNNEAERALRHWVIARRIGMGTRTPQGTRAFALLASVIETCRKRGASPPCVRLVVPSLPPWSRPRR